MSEQEEAEAAEATLAFIEGQLKYFSKYLGAAHDQSTIIWARRYYERLLKIKLRQLQEQVQ